MFLPSNITLKFGDSGDFVAELQRRLAAVKCFPEDQVNGSFDSNTVNAVTHFQSREGLHADGVAGPETLRRLNGVIAGDTSGASDKKEEEAQALSQAAITQDIMQQPVEPAYDPFAAAPTTHSPYGEEAYKQHAAAPAPEPVAAPAPPPPAAPAPDAALAAQRAEALATQQQQHLTPPPPAAGEMLAGMLLNNPPPVQQQPPAQQPVQPHPSEFKPAAPPVEPQQAVAAEPQQAQGLMGRARQFASGMMQKLSDYFEAKLPPSVLKEVQSIGVTMAAAGLKEAPIPTGPEMASPALPGRGQEQTQQRG